MPAGALTSNPELVPDCGLLKSTPAFYSRFVFPIEKSKESELTELIKLILLKHDRVKKKNEA